MSKKIFRFQFKVIGIALLICAAVTVGIILILSFTLGPGDGLGALAVAVDVLPVLVVIFLALLLILGIWGLGSVLSLQKLKTQILKQGLLGKLSFIFSSLLVIFPLVVTCFLVYEFYILPHREFADIQKTQDSFINYKKGLVAEFSEPQMIQDVNTQFILEDPLILPKFFPQPEFILQSGKRILSADLLWGCGGSQSKINDLANGLKGKTVNLRFQTWYGGVSALEFDASKNAREDKTLPIPSHIYLDGSLISCDSIH